MFDSVWGQTFAILGGFVVQGLFASAATLACGPATLAVHADLCTGVTGEFVAEIKMTDLSEAIDGVQFFLVYSQTNLEIVSVAAGDDPFFLPLRFDACIAGVPQCSEKPPVRCCTPGRVEGAVGAFRATSEDAVVDRIRFRVIASGTVPFIRFDRTAHPPNRLSAGGREVIPLLIDAGPPSTDLHRFADFQNCFSEGQEPLTGCRCEFDIDGDADVDLADYEKLEFSFAGPSSTCE